MPNEEIQFQTYSYTFPKTAYLTYFCIKRPGKDLGVWWPSGVVLARPTKNLATIEELEKDLKRSGNDFQVSRNPLFLALQLQELIPLKKEMWADGGAKYPFLNRLHDFNKCLVNPEWYNILVVPENIDHGKEYFEAALPIRQSLAVIDWVVLAKQFNFPVDPCATHAALYKLGKLYQLNQRKLELAVTPQTIMVNPNEVSD